MARIAISHYRALPCPAPPVIDSQGWERLLGWAVKASLPCDSQATPDDLQCKYVLGFFRMRGNIPWVGAGSACLSEFPAGPQPEFCYLLRLSKVPIYLLSPRVFDQPQKRNYQQRSKACDWGALTAAALVPPSGMKALIPNFAVSRLHPEIDIAPSGDTDGLHRYVL